MHTYTIDGVRTAKDSPREYTQSTDSSHATPAGISRFRNSILHIKCLSFLCEDLLPLIYAQTSIQVLFFIKLFRIKWMQSFGIAFGLVVFDFLKNPISVFKIFNLFV